MRSDSHAISQGRSKPWLPFVLIIAFGALAHLWCLNSQFYMDDMHGIRDNEALRSGEWFPRIGLLAWTHFSYQLQYRLFGLTPLGVHAVNWLLHTAVACMLFVFGREFLRGRAPQGVALFGALLFVVHPLCSEIPNYARCQDLAWVTLFSLVACWAVLRFLQDGHWRYLPWLAIGVVGATMSKGPGMFHVGMMTGAVALACLGPQHRAHLRRWGWWLALALLAGFAVLWFAGVIPRMWNATRLWHEPRFIGHAYTLTRVFWEFAWRAVIPVQLCSDHHIAETLVPPGTGIFSIPDRGAMFAAASMLALTAVSLWLAWRKPTRAFGICLFLFTATIGFRVLYLIPEFMPEYRIYPGMPWFCLGAALLLHALWQRLPGGGSPRLAAALILLPCIVLSARRSFVWHSIESLTADILRQYPTQARAIWTRHLDDADAGRWQRIIDRQQHEWPVVFRRCLEENERLAPARELPTGHLALADVACAGRHAEALAHTAGPAAGIAAINRLEAYIRQLRLDSQAHKVHWSAFYEAKLRVLELAGDPAAALAFVEETGTERFKQADVRRLQAMRADQLSK